MVRKKDTKETKKVYEMTLFIDDRGHHIRLLEHDETKEPSLKEELLVQSFEGKVYLDDGRIFVELY